MNSKKFTKSVFRSKKFFLLFSGNHDTGSYEVEGDEGLF